MSFLHHRNAIYYAAPFLLAGMILTGEASASSFYVNPVRIILTPDKKTGILSVTNNGDSAVSFRIQSQSWTQVNGKDLRGPTNDLIVSPPIATVRPGTAQLVRIGPTSSDRSRERAYRIIIEEIPSAATAGHINMALRFDLPMYIASARKTPPAVSWRLVHMADGHIGLRAEDLGSEHVELRKIFLAANASDAVIFQGPSSIVLAGSAREWALPDRWKQNLENKAELVAETNTQVARVQVDEGAH